MWRRFSRALDWIYSRRLVGEDTHHRYYAEYISKQKPERRYVEYKDNNITHSTERMPIEWWSWLHNRRTTPPTIEEIVAAEQRQQSLRHKVAVLEAEDEKQRLRQLVTGGKKQYTERKQKVKGRLLKAAMKGEEGIVKMEDVIKEREGEERNEEEEPQGAGEDFQPGSWQPGSTSSRQR